jgi:hypothetical protein
MLSGLEVLRLSSPFPIELQGESIAMTTYRIHGVVDSESSVGHLVSKAQTIAHQADALIFQADLLV